MLTKYLAYIKDTEPRENFHRWSFLSTCAAVLAKNVYLPFGHGKIYPNMYVLLVGGPGTRKSTSIKIAQSLAKQSGYVHFSFNKSSKQKFLQDFSEGFDISVAGGTVQVADLLDRPFNQPIHEAYVCIDEFIDFLGVGNIDFINLLTNLWDWDEDYSERFKNSQSVKVPRPCLNILGGVTPTNLQMAIPKEALGQGFMSRLILVYADSIKRKITFPKPPDMELQAELTEFLVQLRQFKGVMSLSPVAEETIDKIYHTWRNTFDVRLESYAARRFVHLVKLCIISAASRFSLIIDLADVLQANTILYYTEQTMPNALGDFGQSKQSEAISKIITFLQTCEGYTSDVRKLYKQVIYDVNGINELQQILNNLRQGEKIVIHGNDITLKKEVPVDITGQVEFETYIEEYRRN